jgi:pyrroline-5-carboxylate reductase
MKTLGILGFGTMGEAFARGLKRMLPDLALCVFDLKAERVEAAEKTLGLMRAHSAAELFDRSDLTILCVKSWGFTQRIVRSLLSKSSAAEVRGHSRGKPVVSILAGKRIQTLCEGLATDHVARFMPNIAAVTGKSLVGVSFAPAAEAGFRADCLAVASALGRPLEIPEKLMSAMTGISGSGIAYVLSFVHAMALGGVAAGFDYPTALSIAAAGLESAASLLVPGAHPLELASRVASPAGTTIQGMRALEKGGFTATVMEAVEAAARRATELEN